MKKYEIFEHSDFIPFKGINAGGCRLLDEEAAQIANKRLVEIIEKAPIVYGQGIGSGLSANWCMNGPDTEVYKHTHIAKLLFMEEIPKTPVILKFYNIKHLFYNFERVMSDGSLHNSVDGISWVKKE